MDDIDYKIIESLKRNGRLSLTEMAEKIDLTRVAIANRLDKLITKEFICIRPLINSEKAKLTTLILEANADNKAKFSDLLNKSAFVVNYFETTSDKYNYLIILMGNSMDELKSFIDEKLRRLAIDMKIMLSSNPKGCKYVYLKGFSTGEKNDRY